MNMKIKWEAADIKPGRYYYRGDSPKAEIGYLASVTHKIGFLAGEQSGKNYVSIAITDGMVTNPKTKEEFAAMLNEEGYVPLATKRLTQIVDHLSDQNEGI